MRPVMERLRDHVKLRDMVQKLIKDLEDDLIAAKVHWKEIAYIDKIMAIKLFKLQYTCTLMEAKKAVDNWIENGD